MAADARDAVRRLPEVGEVTVVLEDHYTGDEINAAVGRGEGVRATRSPARPRASSTRCATLFQRKALVARQARLCEALLAGGATAEEVTARRVADLPTTRTRAAASSCARELGIDVRRGVRAPATASRSRPTDARASGCAWRGSCARASRPTAASAAPCCRSATIPIRGGGGMKAARLHAYHEALKLEQVDEPKATEPVRRRREDRRGRAVPHRPAHPGGPVGGEVRGRAALHARPRERGLGARGRLRR